MKFRNMFFPTQFLVLCVLLFPTARLLAGEPLVKNSIKNAAGDRVVLLETDEPHLYYVVPELWKIYNNQVYLEKSDEAELTPQGGEQTYDLTFILAPVYKEAEAAIAAIKKKDKRALFLAAPKKFTKADLNIPTEIGETVKELSPVSDFPSSEYFYYRVSLSAEQVYHLAYLTKRNILLTGILTYEFPYDGQPLETFTDIHVDLPNQLFLPFTRPSHPGQQGDQSQFVQRAAQVAQARN